MKRVDAIRYVGHVVDDAGAGRPIHADPHAIVREGGRSTRCESCGRAAEEPGEEYEYPSRLIGWQCGYEPMFVAVHSYLDVAIDDQDAEEMAIEYLSEIGWFGDESRQADYIL